MPPEKEQKLREALDRIYGPSERARNPDHPVGETATAIRAALPEFQSWQIDLSQVDLSETYRRMFDGKGQAFAFLQPPDLTAESKGSYITSSRGWLVKDKDGRFCTSTELMQRKTTSKEFKEQIQQKNKLSDTLFLWMRSEMLDMHDIEELLRRLSKTITPEVPVRFCSYEDPRYRTGLRMQLSDNPIPAAIGGVHMPWPGLPEGGHFASVVIYLEPWSEARSGQVVELADFSMADFFDSRKKQGE